MLNYTVMFYRKNMSLMTLTKEYLNLLYLY